jgi:16S rRNA processing protein RimM
VNNCPEELVLLGTIGKPYGLKGWVKVNSYTEPMTNIIQYQPWLLRKPNRPDHPVYISHHRLQANQLVAELSGCLTSEDARQLTGSEICVPRKQLPGLTSREFYWTDLCGLKVYTTQHHYLGIVDHLIETGSNDVLVVIEKKRHLIPFLLDQVIKQVDLEKKTIYVDWDPDF